METRATQWIQALRNSHETLVALVTPLSDAQLQQTSYASEWSIAQVLSHFGSQAEIFGLFLEAGLSGEDPPGRDVFAPIWDSWNARTPRAQADDALQADRTLVEWFESLNPEQHETLHLKLFGTEVDTAGLARMRLGEHAVHTWDIAVVLDPTAALATDAAALLVDTLDQTAARSGKADGKERRVHVSTSEPERHFILESAESVTLSASERAGGPPGLRLPAEALIRLIYGRLDPAHTPPVETDGIDLDELRQMFPGF
jgi:uncharacterized protein (TIGR03083 family)